MTLFVHKLYDNDLLTLLSGIGIIFPTTFSIPYHRQSSGKSFESSSELKSSKQKSLNDLVIISVDHEHLINCSSRCAKILQLKHCVRRCKSRLLMHLIFEFISIQSEMFLNNEFESFRCLKMLGKSTTSSSSSSIRSGTRKKTWSLVTTSHKKRRFFVFYRMRKHRSHLLCILIIFLFVLLTSSSLEAHTSLESPLNTCKL